jgi:threonine/homoserine/homoserine lactone efflux protein
MTGLINFLLAALFSFIGSIPPGTLNLTVIHLSITKSLRVALRFSLAAAVMEYPYAWLAVKFERMITSSPVITENLHLIASIVMTLLGVIALLPGSSKADSPAHSESGGFRRGLILGILNPLAVPYWIGMTAYLSAQGWIETSSPYRLQMYLLGVVLGAFLLLFVLAYLSKRIIFGFTHNKWVKRGPGMLLLALGIYSFIQYLIL